MQADLYAPNYPTRRMEAFIRSGGRCENMLAPNERCPVKVGDWRITRSGWMQFEQLICHHPNGDPENPDAELLFVCWACHMRLHRRPGPGRKKASARKQGYTAVRVAYLLEQLSSSSFHTWNADGGRTGWQIGELCGEASDPLDAIAMALHWQEREIHDLQARLEQARASAQDALTAEERDLIQRRRDAQRRREADLALREPPAHNPLVSADTADLMNAVLAREMRPEKKEVLTYA